MTDGTAPSDHGRPWSAFACAFGRASQSFLRKGTKVCRVCGAYETPFSSDDGSSMQRRWTVIAWERAISYQMAPRPRIPAAHTLSDGDVASRGLKASVGLVPASALYGSGADSLLSTSAIQAPGHNPGRPLSSREVYQRWRGTVVRRGRGYGAAGALPGTIEPNIVDQEK